MPDPAGIGPLSLGRRRFLAVIAGGLLAAPLAAKAQRVGKVPRIALVSTFSADLPQVRELSDAVRQGLRELGYVEGQNIVIDDRSAHGQLERLPVTRLLTGRGERMRANGPVEHGVAGMASGRSTSGHVKG